MSSYTNWQVLKDMLRFLKPYRSRFWAGTFLRVTSDVLWLFPPWALSQIITLAADYQPGDSLAFFWQLMLAVWGIAIYHFIAHDGAKYLLYPIAERMSLDVFLTATKHLFHLDSDWHERENSGNKLQRIRKGAESFNELMRLYVDLVVESTVNIVGVTLVLMTLGPTIDVVLLGFFATYFVLSYVLTRKAAKHSYQANIRWEEFNGLLFEAINNMATIKALSIWRVIHRLLTGSAQRLMAEIKKRVFWFRTRGAALNLYREAFRQAILLYVVLQVFAGRYEVGMILLVLVYFEKIATSAGELSEVSHNVVIAKISLQRLNTILNEKPTVEISGFRSFNTHWKTLALRHVSFSYQRRLVLDDVNLTIRRGEKVGIVGISGTGKSTLFKLLLKLYDRYKGDIQFDGVSLRTIRRSSYIRSVSYVPQETELFNLSLKDNITLFQGGPHWQRRFGKAIKVAHVDDFIHKLPHGVDALIGEKGIRLSGGEKQRVGIARAIYKEPEILFLDEATSHLDAVSEKKIQEALATVFKGITAVVIAHRLSTLRAMDRIVVMHQGKVVEEGSFEDLVKRRGEFWRLWKRQKF